MYGTDTIFVLGKGPSIDDIDPGVFSGRLVIGLNDAEHIVPVDISVFHEEWVIESVAQSGYKSQMYVTSTDFSVPDRTVVKLPYEPLTSDSADLMMQRFLNDETVVIEEVMFLTALQIARYIATARGRTQTVYMVGFDFAPDLGYAEAIEPGYDPEPQDERRAAIEMQEYFLLHTLYMLKNSNLDVVHVGQRPFSSLTPASLNSRFLPVVAMPDAESRDEFEVQITAEITTNHFGDRGRLERLIRASKAAGADFIKLQKRDVETFYTADQLSSPYVSPFGSTFGDYRRALELDKDDFRWVDELCRQLGIRWFVSILDQPSFEYMMDLEPELVKIPSTISEHTDYISYVSANYKGPLVLSTGMTDQNYERWILETFADQERVYLLHCNSAYPTPDAHCNIGVVQHYAELADDHPHLVPGYSSHDHGWIASALAVAAGARMVEKHVKLGNTEWAHFDAVALDLTTKSFEEYVQQVRKAQVMLGSRTKRITESEHHKYSVRAAD